MPSRLTAGDLVQTRFGKGLVCEVRNRGRVLVNVRGQALEIAEADVSWIEAGRQRPRGASLEDGRDPGEAGPASTAAASTVDLHGLTVDEALVRVDEMLNAAFLANCPELRVVHGRSGGRIRGALHKRLREIPHVRFRLDPANPGVTIISL
jgi:DNA mismatch repair protein MutS2